MPEEAVLAGMRVDAANTDARMRYSGSVHSFLGSRDRAFDQARFDPGNRVDQADMRGYMDHPELRGGEHHRDLGRSGQFREQLGVTRINVAAGMERLFIERGGANCVDLPIPG